MIGAWQLKNLKGPVQLFTRIPADVITNIVTGEEYVRGDYVIFNCSWNNKKVPELVENMEHFKLFTKKGKDSMSGQEMLREITVNTFWK